MCQYHPKTTGHQPSLPSLSQVWLPAHISKNWKLLSIDMKKRVVCTYDLDTKNRTKTPPHYLKVKDVLAPRHVVEKDATMDFTHTFVDVHCPPQQVQSNSGVWMLKTLEYILSGKNPRVEDYGDVSKK